jgi:hypothetical protein
MSDWGVFEYKTGVAWHVTPPTEARARYEATQFTEPHEAFPLDVCMALSNAFSHGRMRGHVEAAEQASQAKRLGGSDG